MDPYDQSLMEHIALGEDSVLELKRVFFKGKRIEAPEAKSIADELSAMANGYGGTVVFGVDDRTRRLEPMSADELDVLETWLRNICLDIVDPALDCMIRRIPTDAGMGVLRIDVPRSLFVHKGGHGYFGRVGSSKRELSPEMLARLFQQKSQSRIVCFDEQVVARAGLSDLKPALYSRFRTLQSEADDLAFLRKLHFVAEDASGELHPTVGGVLMASESPEKLIPNAYIQAVAYRGTRRTAADQLDARDICGPLDVQVLEALHFVKRNMRVYAVKRPARVDVPQFSLAAAFEALVNAVAHRDYSIGGSKIRLQMFADRLELFSPGALPNSLTLEEMSERQFTRNELLCSVISRCPLTETVQNVTRMTLMDRRGEGVPIILEEGTKLSGVKPKYELIDDAEVKLTIYSSPGDSPKTLAEIVQNLTEAPDVINRKIKDLMRANPQITQQQIAGVCGVSRSLVAMTIAKLKGAGEVGRNGSDRKGTWSVYR